MSFKSKKAALWKEFSIHVRKSNADYRGYVGCFTCGDVKHYTEMNAGHFKHDMLDYDLMNIHPQCVRCNHYLSGRLDVYAENLIKKYGIKEFNALLKRAAKASSGEIYTEGWLDKMILKYRNSNKDL